MAYLDGYLRNARSQRLKASQGIIKGDRRRHVIHRIMDMLEDFEVTPWEHEGAIRHNMRSALCLLGHDWAPADHEAAGVITAALNKLGVSTRPTWAEGQRDYTVSRDYCLRCHTGLTTDQQAQGMPFCSSACARLMLDYRGYERGWMEDPIGRKAYDMIRKSRTVPRSCEGCQKEFRVNHESKENRFCSKPCRNASLRTRELRPCELCSMPFLPSLKINRFCSKACAAEAGRSQKYIRTCEVCDTAFASAMPYAKHCSGRCNAKAHYWRKKAAKSAPSSKIRTMADTTASEITTQSAGNVVYLTPQIFDGWFREAA
ncbi:hypothetical protein [Rhizobium sp. BE258]|uniref:hypothetical protein n=1 Tax=Rhizobium sp. BE258 TaxID=2817722 RepID=UPI002857FE9D|nr:hypothetical protein [Rhizobium sp. BE258]MDR7147046.1 endogenous inhibitor of DNA gyrase (YacG/DUF329 family) [Rhizobium sp. BE258]